MLKTKTLSGTETSGPPAQVNAWKWWLTIVLFLATILTYLDRQTMSLCAPMICKEFKLTDEQYGRVLAAFRWAYAITHVPAGFMADRLPMRLTYGIAVALWSLAGTLESFVWGFQPLLMTRSALGIGEAFNWPCATRIVANAFGPNDRGLASGVFNSGAAVGSLVAPLIIMPLAVAFGWRVSFFTIGSIGMLWVALWSVTTRRKTAAYGVVNTGRVFSGPCRAAFAVSFLAVGVAVPVLAVQYGGRLAGPIEQAIATARDVWPGMVPWLGRGLCVVVAVVVLASMYKKGTKSIAFWMLVLVAITVNPCWYFLNEWIPKYLHDQRGFGYLSAGLFTAPIFLAADAGNLLSGGLIKFLTAHGWSLRRARGSTLTLAGAMILPVATVPSVENPYLVIALLALGAWESPRSSPITRPARAIFPLPMSASWPERSACRPTYVPRWPIRAFGAYVEPQRDLRLDLSPGRRRAHRERGGHHRI